jgi:ribosomal-protein-alanine N-acetyltransferase
MALRFGRWIKIRPGLITGWHYPPPYDMYNCNPGAAEAQIGLYLKPEYHYYTIWNTTDHLIGFHCFGPDARVPGGDYSVPALDVGGGLKPDLTGQGLGAVIMEAALTFARQKFAPPAFRATVAAFNRRALRVSEKVGYRRISTFNSTASGRPFVILMRDA